MRNDLILETADGTETPRRPRPGRSPRSGRRPWPRRSRRGIGIFQVMLGAAISILVIGASIGLYTSANSTQRAQTVQTTLTALEAEIRRAFANRREYTAEAYQDFLAPRMPSSAIRGGVGDEEIITPWGGEITAGGGTTPGTSNASANRFWIVIEELPRAACIAVAESFLDRRDVFAIDADGTFALLTTNPDDTLTKIEADCDDADENDIGIVFRG